MSEIGVQKAGKKLMVVSFNKIVVMAKRLD